MDTLWSSSVSESPIIGAWSWDIQRDRIAAWSSLSQLLCLEDAVIRRGVTVAQFISAVHPGDRNRIDAAIREAATNGTNLDQTCRVVTAGLGVRSIHLQGAFHSSEDDRPSVMTGFVMEAANSWKRPNAMIVEHLIEARKYAVAANKPVLSKLIEATLYEAGLELASNLRDTFVDHPNL